jgi:hypothetical protein
MQHDSAKTSVGGEPRGVVGSRTPAPFFRSSAIDPLRPEPLPYDAPAPLTLADPPPATASSERRAGYARRRLLPRIRRRWRGRGLRRCGRGELGLRTCCRQRGEPGLHARRTRALRYAHRRPLPGSVVDPHTAARPASPGSSAHAAARGRTNLRVRRRRRGGPASASRLGRRVSTLLACSTLCARTAMPCVHGGSHMNMPHLISSFCA